MSYGVANGVRLYMRDALFFLKSTLNGLRNDFESTSVVLCNSYPKSGTHLLAQILMQVPNISCWNDIIAVQSLSGTMNTVQHLTWKFKSAKDHSLVRSHLMYCKEVLDVLSTREVKSIFIYRDLRDVAISHAKWVMNEKRYFLHDIYQNHYKSDAERLMATICGTPLGTPFGSNLSHPSIGQDFSRWKGWLSDPKTLPVRFEDLVGSRGGGSDEVRTSTIAKILNFVGYELPASEIEKRFSLEALNPNKSHTFRKGMIGEWKSVFADEHKVAFKKHAGDLLVELGYEVSNEW